MLADNAQIVTGADSLVFNGRDGELKLWAEDLAAPSRGIYVRTPDRITLSPVAPMALETGHYKGVDTKSANDWSSGTYFAKWRRIGGTWLIESETYMTTACGGKYCPAARACGMTGPTATRRGFVKALAGLPAIAAAAPKATGEPPAPALAGDELLLEPGIIHLNTASAGPSSERVLARALAAWRRIETDPVWMTYSDDSGSVVSAANRVRAKAADADRGGAGRNPHDHRHDRRHDHARPQHPPSRRRSRAVDDSGA